MAAPQWQVAHLTPVTLGGSPAQSDGAAAQGGVQTQPVQFNYELLRSDCVEC